MAEKTEGLDDIFRKTELPDVEVPATGKTIATGVGLKASELELLDGIAADLQVARNAVMRWGLRYFLKAYLRGEVDLRASVQAPPIKKRLKMP